MGFAAVLAGLAEAANDWLVWVGLGLMGVTTLALVVVLILEKLAIDKRRRVRNQLAAYVQGGRRVIEWCHASARARLPAPEKAGNGWGQLVFDYLFDQLGPDYAVRFDNPAGLPLGTTVLSPPHSTIEGFIKSRLARLGEIIKELAA
ncbi:MAG: hypothetical protein V3S98_03110 [Dehalococcoidia bacterium]